MNLRLVSSVVAGQTALTLGSAGPSGPSSPPGSLACRGYDLWGPAKNTQLYVKPTTMRQADCGGVVLTRRLDVQRAVHEFHVQYQRLIGAYQRRGQYPMNGATQVRDDGPRSAGGRHGRSRGAGAFGHSAA